MGIRGRLCELKWAILDPSAPSVMWGFNNSFCPGTPGVLGHAAEVIRVTSGSVVGPRILLRPAVSLAPRCTPRLTHMSYQPPLWPGQPTPSLTPSYQSSLPPPFSNSPVCGAMPLGSKLETFYLYPPPLLMPKCLDRPQFGNICEFPRPRQGAKEHLALVPAPTPPSPATEKDPLEHTQGFLPSWLWLPSSWSLPGVFVLS